MIYATYTLQCDKCGRQVIGYSDKGEAIKAAHVAHWQVSGKEMFCLACRSVKEVNSLLDKHAYVSSGYVLSDGSEWVRRISEAKEYWLPFEDSIAQAQAEWSQNMRDSHRSPSPFPVKFFARPSTPEEIHDWTTC